MPGGRVSGKGEVHGNVWAVWWRQLPHYIEPSTWKDRRNITRCGTGTPQEMRALLQIKPKAWTGVAELGHKHNGKIGGHNNIRHSSRCSSKTKNRNGLYSCRGSVDFLQGQLEQARGQQRRGEGRRHEEGGRTPQTTDGDGGAATLWTEASVGNRYRSM